jgi:hypothetical protein
MGVRMTAINVITQRDRMIIMTDGAWYDASGVVTSISPKVHLLAHIGAVVAVRGGGSQLASNVIEFVTKGRAAASNFDELVVLGTVSIKHIHEMMMAQGLFFDDSPDMDFVLCGWSPSKSAFEAYVIPTAHRAEFDAAGVKSFTPNRVPDIGFVPVPSPAEFAAVGWTDPESVNAFDPFTHGVRLMEAQRLVVGAMDNGAGKNGVTGHGVGGFVQLTTITREAIETRIIHRWPDKIGERIDTDGPMIIRS